MNQHNNQKIRFKGYDNSLERKTIGDITTSFSGGTPKSSNKTYYEGNIPFIRSGEIRSNQTELFISEDALKDSSAKMVEKGDILYALYGATSGEVAISQINGAINQAILAIKPNLGYSSEFIMNYLKKEKDNILEKYLQGGQGNLSAAIVKSIELHLPSQEEQSAIGSLFRTLYDLLASYKDNLANYQSLKATMLSKMFPNAGQTVPEIRLDGFEGEWEKGTIGEFGSFYYGKSAPKWSVTDDATTPCVRYGELYTKFSTKIDKIYSYTSIPKENLKLSSGNEVLVPRVGENPLDFANCSWLSLKDVAIGEMISVYNTPNNPLFIANYFNAKMKKEFAKRVEGGSVANLYYTYLENISISVPSLPEQQAIGSYFSNLDNLIAAHQDKISQLETLKKKLLQDMFI